MPDKSSDNYDSLLAREDDKLWRNYAKVYDELLKVIPYRNLLLKVVDQAQIEPGMSVLDAGCGTGNLLWALGHVNVECSVTGVDFSKPMMAKAKSKAAKYRGKTSFVLADLDEPAETWNLDGPYDRIVFNNSLCLIQEPRDVLKKMAGLTHPGTILVAATPRPNPSVNEVLDEHLQQSSYTGRSREEAMQELVSVLGPLFVSNEQLFKRYGDSYHLPTRIQLQDWFAGSGWRIRDITTVYAGQDWLVTAVKD